LKSWHKAGNSPAQSDKILGVIFQKLIKAASQGKISILIVNVTI